MANRHLSRSVAVQVLFEWDFNNYPDFEIDDIINRNLKEFAPGLDDREFLGNLIKGVLKNRKKLDSIIEKTAPEWPINQIAPVDRNVLRLGLYELLLGKHKEVPPKVAINESIELAKTFGGDTSGKFVNGVLGTIYREMGEPGKELPLENLGGAVVFREDNKKILFALVHDVFGYWTLSKGKLVGDENAKTGTKRELKEELGVDIKIKEELGVNEYVASHPEKGQIKKRVLYFLAETKDKDLKLEESGGLDDAKWFNLEELDGLKIYDDLKPILLKAVKILKSK